MYLEQSCDRYWPFQADAVPECRYSTNRARATEKNAGLSSGRRFFRLPAICLAPTGANWQKVLLLFLSEQSRFRYEAHPERNFKREARAATGCNINGQVRVLPMLELAFGYVKATTMNLSDQQVAGTNPKFTILEAHG